MLIESASDLSGGVVQIDVGESQTPFDVHVELLCTCSPYFESLFHNRFDGAIAEPLVHLPDDDPQVFAQVILWMYRGDSSVEALGSKKIDFLSRLWILAGKLEMADLQNLVMATCQEKSDQNPKACLGQDTVNYIYSHTVPKSPLRYLAVDIWVRSAATKTFGKSKGEFSRDFLEDLCAEMIKRQAGLPTPERFVSEDRHFIRLSPLAAHEDDFQPPQEETEIKQIATETQLNSRKIAPLRPRIKYMSGKSASTSATTASTGARVYEQQDMAEDLNKLNIHR